MRKVYYTIEHFLRVLTGDHEEYRASEHETRIGKQLKRAEDTAQRMLNNDFVQNVEIVYKDESGTHLVKTFFRG